MKNVFQQYQDRITNDEFKIMYVYGHYTADTNRLFYVGVGFALAAWSYSNRNEEWHETVKNNGLVVRVLASNLGKTQAVQMQQQFIRKMSFDGGH